MKNHYQTLRLPSTASPEEIKKAFRKLAHQYHPDKNDDVATHPLFVEIQEAYNVLGDAKRKRRYDEERYFAGLSSRKEPVAVSAGWILKLATDLRMHTERLYVSDINHFALYDYIGLILSETHLACMEEENDVVKNDKIVKEILQAAKKIRYSYHEKIIGMLSAIQPVSSAIHSLINKERAARKEEYLFRKWFPWLIIITVLMFCFFMYLYSSRY